MIDARPKGRFTGLIAFKIYFLGEAPDPRGIPSGHMPFSKNLPFTELVNPNTGLF